MSVKGGFFSGILALAFSLSLPVLRGGQVPGPGHLGPPRLLPGTSGHPVRLPGDPDFRG